MSNNAANMKTLVNKADNAIEGIKKPTFLVTVALTYVSYIFIFLGISYLLPTYIRSISNVLHVVICLFLIYKFNPLRSAQQITETDKNLIFFAALFIIMSTRITEFTISFFDSMKQVLKKDLSSSMY